MGAEEWKKQGDELFDLGQWEEAVASYDQALKFQPDYYKAWHRRGTALYYLGQWEEAVTSYDQALKFQPDLHGAWNNRGSALGNLGQREAAIASYDQAVQLKPDFHEAWYNQGNALGNLGQYEAAVASYDRALQLKPDDHAAWNNRGVVLRNLGQYEAAIASYDQALQLKPDDHQVWNNRGNAAGSSVSYDPLLAFQSSIARKHPQLNQRGYEGALASYQQGLEYCPQDTHPEGWGLMHKEIGNAHYERGHGDARPRPYWHEAVKSYKQALKTLTAKAFPEWHLEVLQNLIRVYDYLGKREYLPTLLAEGTDLLGRLLQETPSDFHKIRLSRKFASFNQLRVDQLAQTGDICAALELAEQRKNLCLGWMLNRWSDSTDSPNYTQMQKLLQPAVIQLSKGTDGQIYVTLPNGKQSVGNKAIVYWHISPAAITTFILKYGQPPIIVSAKNGQSGDVFLPSLADLDPPQPPLIRGENQVKVPLTKGDLGGAPGSATHPTKENSFKVPLSKGDLGGSPGLNPQTETSTLPPSFHQLIEFEKWLETWKKQENWQQEMPNYLKNLAEILNIQAILSHLKDINQLILIPHRDLHLLPLHALFVSSMGEGQGERVNFTIKYLPSIKVGLNRQNPKPNTSLLSIENPTEDLRYAPLESEAICRLYPNAHRIAASAATKTAVKNALAQKFDIFHFTGHGEHNLEQPGQSALLLANQERLTLKDILELDLSSYNLACLSACKTNFTSKVGLIDEFIGLASGFVAAGVNNVIGSLWKVDDCSTAYLMTKFQEILNNDPHRDVPSALKEAQEWLRNATNAELDQFPFPLQRSQIRDVGRLPAQEIAENKSPDHKPYESPYYWAGFCAIGL